MDLKNGYVLLPQPIEDEARKLLEDEGLDIVVAPDPSPATVAPLMRGARAIILRTGIVLDRELLEASDDLWTISRTGGGVDNVDLKAATEKGIIVTSSLGVNASTVAEHTISLILALFKQLFLMDREVRKNNFKIRYKNYPQDVLGKRLGIVGFGRIGQILAGYFHPLSKTKVLAYDPLLTEEVKNSFADTVDFVGLEELLRASDVVSIHVPLNKYTRNMIGWEQLSLMKREAYLVNVSRGGVVNEQDLIRALKEGVIRGAGLDVFENEPIEAGNPLLEMDNVILTPHTAALTEECVVRMATEAVKRVIDLFNGYEPAMIANPEVLRFERWQHLKKR
ncbi:MAG: hydroxyacid dehydrogenase [Firmicutes bacterium]|jgi:D-3-phosphoglycerate dehydrogenase|nr:hydroxyacid dehydrogenase [Bacillota bacterium]MDH7494682.1 hydroxyacid dehydrogenase [Bacillota bacterium]